MGSSKQCSVGVATCVRVLRLLVVIAPGGMVIGAISCIDIRVPGCIHTSKTDSSGASESSYAAPFIDTAIGTLVAGVCLWQAHITRSGQSFQLYCFINGIHTETQNTHWECTDS